MAAAAAATEMPSVGGKNKQTDAESPVRDMNDKRTTLSRRLSCTVNPMLSMNVREKKNHVSDIFFLLWLPPRVFPKMSTRRPGKWNPIAVTGHGPWTWEAVETL